SGSARTFDRRERFPSRPWRPSSQSYCCGALITVALAAAKAVTVVARLAFRSRGGDPPASSNAGADDPDAPNAISCRNCGSGLARADPWVVRVAVVHRLHRCRDGIAARRADDIPPVAIRTGPAAGRPAREPLARRAAPSGGA